jgi:hypothetical protein
MIRRILKVKFAIVRMPGAAIRIVGVDVQDDKLYDVLVQNIGESDLEDVNCVLHWAVCIKRGDGSIVSPSVKKVVPAFSEEASFMRFLCKNSVLRIHVDPTRLYLQSGPVKITVNGPEGTSASYTIEH